MRLYPSLPGPLRRTIALDVVVLVLFLLFAWLGLKVHDSVTELNSLSRGITEAGSSTQATLQRAGDAVGAAPIIGGQLRDSLQGAGQEAGGTAASLGRESRQRIDALAKLLGILTWLIPSVLTLMSFLPGRWRQATRLTAGAQVLAAGAHSVERRRLIAQRAAFGLPYGVLLRHTRDPLGDLEAGRYDALVAAELEAAGLRDALDADVSADDHAR